MFSSAVRENKIKKKTGVWDVENGGHLATFLREEGSAFFLRPWAFPKPPKNNKYGAQKCWQYELENRSCCLSKQMKSERIPRIIYNEKGDDDAVHRYAKSTPPSIQW